MKIRMPNVPRPVHDGLLGVFFAMLVVMVGWLVWQNHMLTQDVSNLKHTAATKDALAASQNLLSGDITYTWQLERPLLDTDGKTLYFPEFRIRLPFTPLSRTIFYDMRSNTLPYGSNTDPAEADILSSAFAGADNTVVNCGDMLRIKLESNPNAYSPHEKVSTVHLADGRTLQLYELVNEKECTDAWNNTVSPEMLNDIFKQAQSY